MSSILKVANIHFEATGSNRLEYGHPTSNNIHIRTGSGNGNFVIVIGSTEMINVNSSIVVLTGGPTTANLTTAWNTANSAANNITTSNITTATITTATITTAAITTATITTANTTTTNITTANITAANIATSLSVHGTTSLANTNIVAQTLTDDTTITWNTSLGQIATVTLGGNRTLANATNLKVGTYILNVVQDGTGSRTLTFGRGYFFTGNVKPTLTVTAAARDIISGFSDGTNMYCTWINDLTVS